MQYLLSDAGTGAFGAYGTLGFWTPASGILSLPPGLTVNGTLAGFSPNASQTANRLQLPVSVGGGELPNTYAGSPSDIVCALTTSGPIDWTVSVRLLAPSSRTVNVDLTNADGSVSYISSGLTGDTVGGLWVRFRAILGAAGTFRIRIWHATNFPRWQGFLLDNYGPGSTPGRLLCFEAGRSGLIG